MSDDMKADEAQSLTNLFQNLCEKIDVDISDNCYPDIYEFLVSENIDFQMSVQEGDFYGNKDT
jgi:hypothetical protein